MEQQLKKRRNNEEMGYGCALKDEEFGEWSHQHYGISNGSKLAIGLMASGIHIKFMNGGI